MTVKDPVEKIVAFERGFSTRIESINRFFGYIVKTITYNFLMILFLFFVFYVLILFVAPFLIKSESIGLRGTGALSYVLVSSLRACHQLPQRTFIFSGIPQPVCARDIGVYVGLIFGAIIPLLFEKSRRRFGSIKITLLFILPLAVDGISQSIFLLWESNNLIRVLTGFLLGLGIAGYFVTKFLKRFPDFKDNVLKFEHIAGSFFAVILILSVILYILSPILGSYYASYSGVSRYASAPGEQTLQVYYVPPLSPLSVHYDPFIQNYDDPILSDLQKLNTTSQNFLSGLDYKFGLWVVVDGEGNLDVDGKTVYTDSKGTYYYIDPVTKEIVANISH